MYSSICAIDVVLDSMDMISNSSPESNDCIMLHSSSELFVFSVTSFTCCDRHILAKWLGLVQFLKVFPMARHIFRWPSRTGFCPDTTPSVFCIVYFLLYLSLGCLRLFGPLFPLATIGSRLIFICVPWSWLALAVVVFDFWNACVVCLLCSNLRAFFSTSSGGKVSKVNVSCNSVFFSFGMNTNLTLPMYLTPL